MKFEIFKDSKKQYRFRIKAGNNKVIAQSEGYKNKRNAEKSARAIGCEILDHGFELKDLTV